MPNEIAEAKAESPITERKQTDPNSSEISSDALAVMPQGTKVRTLYEENADEAFREPIFLQFMYRYALFRNACFLKCLLGGLLLTMGIRRTNLLILLPPIYLAYQYTNMLTIHRFHARYRCYVEHMRPQLFQDVVDGIGLMITAYGWLFFYLEFIDMPSIYLFALPHLAYSLGIALFSHSGNFLSTIVTSYTFLKSAQLAYAFFVFGQNVYVKDWAAVFVVLRILCQMLYIVAHACLLLMVLITIFCAYRFSELSYHDRVVCLITLVVLAVIGMELLFPHIVIKFTIEAFSADLFNPKALPDALPIFTQTLGAQLFSIYAILLISSIIVQQIFVRMYIGIVRRDTVKSILLMTFPEAINSGYGQVSETFFKRQSRRACAQHPPTGFESCLICFTATADVIMQPCGHSGYCQTCIITWVKNSKTCPACKTAIERLLVVVLDPESRKIMTTGIIRIN